MGIFAIWLWNAFAVLHPNDNYMSHTDISLSIYIELVEVFKELMVA